MSNPTKSIALRGGQLLRMSVACGKCAHCVTRKRDEYSFRTYWHTYDTINNGGYVLFDTLTYSDKYLPRLFDFINPDDYVGYNLENHSCFNRVHYKLFFKRLRRRIQSQFGLTDAITYFLSTEYGDDDRYTHRPHYHFLIFVKFKCIHPLWLSRIIAQCWQYGRTDGIVYKPLKYVARHVYGYDLGFGLNTETHILRAVTHYVAKYINKSIKFQNVIDKRISTMELALIKDDDSSEKIKNVLSQISMFHQHSQGYGLSYLKYLGDEEKQALKHDMCLLPDKVKIVKSLPLPTYYMRKLYYECIKVGDKRLWQLTEFGKQHKINSYISNIKKQVESYENLYLTLSPVQKSELNRLLGTRTFYDLVIYNTFYCGRLRHHTACNYYTHITNLELSEQEELYTSWLDVILHSFDNNSLDKTTCAVCDDFKDVFVNNYIGDVITDVDAEYPFFKMDKKEFISLYTFNQNSDPRFKNFDVLNDFINCCRREINKNQQSTYDNKVELAEKLKQFTHVKFN